MEVVKFSMPSEIIKDGSNHTNQYEHLRFRIWAKFKNMSIWTIYYHQRIHFFWLSVHDLILNSSIHVFRYWVSFFIHLSFSDLSLILDCQLMRNDSIIRELKGRWKLERKPFEFQSSVQISCQNWNSLNSTVGQLCYTSQKTTHQSA